MVTVTTLNSFFFNQACLPPFRGGETLGVVPSPLVSLSTSCRDFQVCEGDSYTCKWFSPLDKVEVVDADYHVDIWDYIVAGGELLAMRGT